MFAERALPIIVLVFGLFLDAPFAAAEPRILSADAHVDLLKLTKELGGVLEWNPARQTGILSYGTRNVSLRVGTPWVLVDYSTPLFVGNIKRRQGSVILSKDGAEKLRQLANTPKEKSVHHIGAVLIDPGHGGRDPGASNTHKFNHGNFTLLEKEVVLETSRVLHELLAQRYPKKKIVLSRSDDRYLTLEERTALANSLLIETDSAVIFLSVHANASPSKNASGFEVWYLPEDYRREVILPNSHEARAPKLTPILNTVQEESLGRDSRLLAEMIVNSIAYRVGDLSSNRGIREESWFVVRNAKMPAVLIELGFTTNEHEAELLADSGYLRTLAEAIYSAVTAFVRSFEETQSL